MTDAPTAPELVTSHWFNSESAITLDALRGEVIVIEASQMLCPGCVTHGLPLAQRIHETFRDEVTVLGLHTVFEHHAAMTPVSLEAFLHEHRITFPVGVDSAQPGSDTPITMERCGLRGTPSLLVIDRSGRLRANVLSETNELTVGALLARLLDEGAPQTP
jgi:peroxiredoxin